MRLDLDTEIRYPSGERAGVLLKAIVGEGGHVDNVVMATDEFVSRNVIVPVSDLSEGAGGVLTTNLTPDQIDGLSDYVEELVPAVTEWEGSADPAPGEEVFPSMHFDPTMMPVTEVANVPEGSISVSQGTEIWCEGERWGIVDEVLLNDAGNVAAFVGRSDNVYEHDRIIPIELVSGYDANAVTLSCTLADLPNYTEETNDELEEPDAE